MNQFLIFIFSWAAFGLLFTTMAGIKTGFWWFVFLGLPAGIIVIGLALAFVLSVIGAFIGFVTARR